MNGESTTQAYVAIDVAEERIEPSEESEVVNRLDRGQYVRVFEEANGWSRVTWYYDHFFDGREIARWIKSSSLSPDKPPAPEHGLPETRLGAALTNPDIAPRAVMIAQDFARVRGLGAFSRGARGGTPRKRKEREGVPLAREKPEA